MFVRTSQNTCVAAYVCLTILRKYYALSVRTINYGREDWIESVLRLILATVASGTTTFACKQRQIRASINKYCQRYINHVMVSMHVCDCDLSLSLLLLLGENRTNEEFMLVNPHKKVPAIDDNGFTLSERSLSTHFLF